MSTMPRPSPNILPAELLVLVGKIAIQSVYVDFLLGEVLGSLKNVHGGERARTIHVLDTRRKSQEAEKLLRASSNPDDVSLATLVKRAGELLADRNMVLHSAITYADEDNDFSFPQLTPFRGKYVGKYPPFSEETLKPIFEDLDQISRELMAACLGRGFVEYVSLSGKQS